jgi:DNA polymerase-3 subunit gamma/tau
MTYQVLARKWRPQEFDTVVGQEPVTRTLRNALLSGRVAHAYLFTGPRGVGKTTTARLLAKALCCTDRRGAEACGACPSCRDFVTSAPVDVMEIDAASNTGVEDIRTLRENVKYAPARGRFKVYIVDEVHMLSRSAFNAFLKTLEEPPEHVVFILATTDPKQIPATVLSRCQRFDFKPIPPEALTESLSAILTKEGVPFEASALPLLVRASEGSLRDALSLLDTAIAYGEGKLDEANVAQLLGASSPAHVRAFVEALLGRDGGAALAAIDRAAGAGEDLGSLCRDVVEMVRRQLVLKTAPGTTLPDLTPAEAEALRAAAAPASVDELIYLLRAFLDADAEMRRSPHPRVELEIAAVRATRRPEPQLLDTLLAKVEDALGRMRSGAPVSGSAAARPAALQDALPAAAPPAPAPRGVATAGTPSSRPSRADAPRDAAIDRDAPSSVPPAERAAVAVERASRTALAEAAAPPAPELSNTRADAAPPGGDLGEAWQRVVAEVMRRKAMLGTVLQGAAPLGVDGEVLLLSLVGNHFHRDRLTERVNRDLINQIIQEQIPGVRRFELGNGAAGAGGARNHPAVQAALDVFQGEVVAVRPRAPEEGDES